MSTSVEVARTRTVDDVEVPTFLYGTAWKEERTRPLVARALEEGFRGIDTANQRRHYHEEGVGEAVQAWLAEAGEAGDGAGGETGAGPEAGAGADGGGRADLAVGPGGRGREALFLQTKFTHVDSQDARLPYDPDADLATQVRQSFDSSLEHLGVERMDSYLLHGPRTRRGIGEGDREVWRTLEELQRSGRARLIGISNVSPGQLRELCELAEVRPAFVQNRCFARTGWDRQVRRLCRDRGILYQGFSLLTANRAELASDVMHEIAVRNEMTLPQVVFRFALQVGMICLTGTTDPEHMREDLTVYERELPDADVEAIESLSG